MSASVVDLFGYTPQHALRGQDRRKRRPIFTSDDQTWNTPRWFIERIENALGRVRLDPCSNEWSEVGAETEVRESRGEDGLAIDWSGRGLIYVNPPFGRVIGTWMDKLATADEGVALVPSRTDAAWWQRSARSCSALVLWRGRFTFRIRASERGNAPFPSSVFYFGQRPFAFLNEFARDGFVAKGAAA